MESRSLKSKSQSNQGIPAASGAYEEEGTGKNLVRRVIENSEHPFGYCKIAGIVLTFVLLFMSIAHLLSAKPSRLYSEGGLIEWLSFICWFMSMLICFLALSRQCKQIDRLVIWWICLLCFLAAARELDAQIFLNPKYLGQFGVHYKTRWFLSPEVNFFLKLFWFMVFLTLGGFLFYPLIKLGRHIIRLIRNGDAATGFFLLGATGLITGFLFDDILRKTTFLDKDFRESVEEVAELLGAAFFFMGTGLLSWRPFSERIENSHTVSERENANPDSGISPSP
jgi:hypothetical protein